jgi:hypothetical protein
MDSGKQKVKKTFGNYSISAIFATSKTRRIVLKIYCGVEQLVARWAHNPKAVSSSLAPATKNPVNTGFFILYLFQPKFILVDLKNSSL